MKKPIITQNSLLKIVNNSLIDLPSPSNMNYWWNFGSLLGLCLVTQMVSGLFLAGNYSCDMNLAFLSISNLMHDSDLAGGMIRVIHLNAASLFFVFLYLHISRGMYNQSYRLIHTWSVGMVMFLMVMITAFLGYVLPWGQMSYWGASVMTGLVSAMPYMGSVMMDWIWGGFTVANPTLTRFFSFHFMMPFMMAMFVMIHLIYLHQTGSNNPLGINSNLDKLYFHPFFTIKDLLGFAIAMFTFLVFMMLEPYTLGDPENFILANPLVTPVHMQPEWYFLFAYAILRSIPNKLGGVMAMVFSMVMWFFLPLTTNTELKQSNKFNYKNQLMNWCFFNMFLVLTWIGARPVEQPYMKMGLYSTVIYFSLVTMIFIL